MQNMNIKTNMNMNVNVNMISITLHSIIIYRQSSRLLQRCCTVYSPIVYTVRDKMPSRKVLKIVATVLLVVGNIFMLGFLGILLYITLALTVFAVPLR